MTFPRGVDIEIEAIYDKWSPAIRCGDLASYLPDPPTSIRDLLAPITAIESSNCPRHLHLSGNGGSFSFRNDVAPPRVYQEIKLFTADAVRQFHIYLGHLKTPSMPWLLERLPALEVLIISDRYQRIQPESLSPLAKEPVLCLSLKTIAFFNCTVDRYVLKALGEILVKREHSTAARLHRILFVIDRDVPDGPSTSVIRKHVPRVDFVVGHELPDLLSHVTPRRLMSGFGSRVEFLVDVATKFRRGGTSQQFDIRTYQRPWTPRLPAAPYPKRSVIVIESSCPSGSGDRRRNYMVCLS